MVLYSHNTPTTNIKRAWRVQLGGLFTLLKTTVYLINGEPTNYGAGVH